MIRSEFLEHLDVVQKTLKMNQETIGAAAKLIVRTLRCGNKILLCGNGGSAADCQHFAAELVGRFEAEKNPLPAVALTTDSSVLTAISNDYGTEYIFSKQIEALGNSDDLLIAISTSGNSKNVLRAIDVALIRKMSVLLLTGENGGKAMEYERYERFSVLRVSSSRTARIQEVHLLILHVICHVVDIKKNPPLRGGKKYKGEI